MVVNGTAPVYLQSTMYIVVGALLGTPNGAEFMTAIQAANQVTSAVSADQRNSIVPCMPAKANGAYVHIHNQACTYVRKQSLAGAPRMFKILVAWLKLA